MIRAAYYYIVLRKNRIRDLRNQRVNIPDKNPNKNGKEFFWGRKKKPFNDFDTAF